MIILYLSNLNTYKLKNLKIDKSPYKGGTQLNADLGWVNLEIQKVPLFLFLILLIFKALM